MSRLKKKKILIAAGIVLVSACIAAAILWGIWYYLKAGRSASQRAEGCCLVHSMKKNELLGTADLVSFEYDKETEGPYATVEQTVGKRLLSDTAEGTRLTENAVYEGEPLTDDVRLHKYTCIKLTEKMKKGDYVDIRISFANGGDFILLSKKQIQDIHVPEENESENALWLNVSEEEILRLSSAVVDAYLNEGCSIYAIQYIQKGQKAAVMNYKVNDVVEQLIEDDPNIVKKAENVLEWELWKELKGEGNDLSLEEPYEEEAEDGEDVLETPLPEEASENEIIYFD